MWLGLRVRERVFAIGVFLGMKEREDKASSKMREDRSEEKRGIRRGGVHVEEEVPVN